MSSDVRTDGYAPIESYAVLGDGAAVALLSSDGRVDWWAAPRLDDPPVFAALLDPGHGGSFSVVPDRPFDLRRRYLPGTNVIESIYDTGEGQARMTIGLNRGGITRLSWSELACRTEGLSGIVRFVASCDLAEGLGAGPAQIVDGDPPYAVRGDQHVALLGAGPPVVEDAALVSRFEVRPGQRAVAAVVVTQGQPLYLSPPWLVDRRLDDTVTAWQRWSRDLHGGGRWAQAVERSALVLKVLLRESSGAIAAAATTSLPERIGGDKNWDYRFAWVRDSSFSIEALFRLGLHDEVQAGVAWLLDAIRRSDRRLHVFYSLAGQTVDTQSNATVPGYRRSQPVQLGNQASDQLQLGCYGDFLDVLADFARRGHVLDQRSVELVTELVDRCADEWQQPDSGIWELTDQRQYTISKMGCWVAFDRAAELAAAGTLDRSREAGWRARATEVAEWVHEHCWSGAKRSYVLYAGTEDLDAATLLAGRMGFDRGARLAGTTEAVLAELTTGPYVYRYTGMAEKEGAFVACSFWLVQALAWTGQHRRAVELMDQAVGMANDLGLLAEQIDPADGSFLGNVPQALSHLALIDAAHLLAPGTTRSKPPGAPVHPGGASARTSAPGVGR